MRVAIQNAILIGLIILILSYVIRNAQTTTTEPFPKGAPFAFSGPKPEPEPPSKPAHELELFQWAYNNDLEPPKAAPASGAGAGGIQGFDASEVVWSQI
jgi:hypothetical protein